MSKRLGDQHFGISATAVAQFARHEQIDDATARAELESCLVDAHQTSDPERWRLRSRTTGLDITARTTLDPVRKHLVVVGLSIREVGRRPLRSADRAGSVSPSAPAAPLNAAPAPASAARAAAPLTAGAPSAGADTAGPHAPLPPGSRVVEVRMTPAEHLELVAELRGDESPAALLLSSGLATARARARARKARA